MNLRPIFVGLVATLALTVGMGCSLIKVETGTEPIPEKEMNLRLATNDFAVYFTETVEAAADTILSRSNELEMQLSALRWKLSAFQAIRRSSFRTAPVEAFMDTWVLTAQMAAFFRDGDGSALFGEWQHLVVAECDTLLEEITLIARGMQSAIEFSELQEFVLQEATRYPLANLSMERHSAVAHWRSFAGIADSTAVTTVGTLPQAVTQVGTQVVTVAEHTPKAARWNVEMLRRKSRIDSINFVAKLDSLTSLIQRIAAVAEESPEILGESIELLAVQLEAALAEVDLQRSATLLALAEEREAIIAAFERERTAILQAVDDTATEVVDNSLHQLQRTIIGSLLIIGLVLIVLFSGPFLLGYMAGKARRSRAG
jgi:hypothetical protein